MADTIQLYGGDRNFLTKLFFTRDAMCGTHPMPYMAAWLSKVLQLAQVGGAVGLPAAT